MLHCLSPLFYLSVGHPLYHEDHLTLLCVNEVLDYNLKTVNKNSLIICLVSVSYYIRIHPPRQMGKEFWLYQGCLGPSSSCAHFEYFLLVCKGIVLAQSCCKEF